MDSISVKVSALYRISSNGAQVQKRILSMSTRLAECSSTLYDAGSSYENVTVTLTGLAERLKDNSAKVGILFKQLEDIANLYKNTEASIAQMPIILGTGSKNVSAGGEIEGADKTTAADTVSEYESLLLQLMALGLTERDLKNAEKNGLSLEYLLSVIEQMETEEDRQFFSDILKGNYQDAFGIDPNKVTSAMLMFLVAYAHGLVSQGNDQELQNFINGILYTDDNRSMYGDNPKNRAYGSEYLAALATYSAALLDMETASFWDDPTAFDDVRKTSYNNLVNESALWNTLYSTSFSEEAFQKCLASGKDVLIDCELDKVNPDSPSYDPGYIYNNIDSSSATSGRLYGSRISNLRNKGRAGFSYDIEYEIKYANDVSAPLYGDNICGGRVLSERPLHIDVTVNTSLAQIDDSNFAETMQDLRKQKEQLPAKYAIALSGDIVSTEMPLMGALYKTAKAIADGNVGSSIKGAEGFLDKCGLIGESYKKTAGNGASIGATVVDSFSEWRKINQNLSSSDLQQKIKKYGSTSRYEAYCPALTPKPKASDILTHTVQSGFYNLRANENIQKINSQGLAALINVGEPDNAKMIVQSIGQKVYPDRDTDAVKTLLYGSAQTGKELQSFSGEELSAAESAIEDAYKNAYSESNKAPFGENLDILSLISD